MIRKILEKLLYLTWRGASRRESREEVENQDERIQMREAARIEAGVSVSVKTPTSDDFDSAFNLHDPNSPEGDREDSG